MLHACYCMVCVSSRDQLQSYQVSIHLACMMSVSLLVVTPDCDLHAGLPLRGSVPYGTATTAGLIFCDLSLNAFFVSLT
jgi:hypothetical protein